jgi:hypothetical protein
VDTQSKTGNTAIDISREVKEHVLGKAARRIVAIALLGGNAHHLL